LEYKNYYHQDFKKDYDTDTNPEQPGYEVNESSTPKPKSRLLKKKSLMEDLINSKTLKRKSMKENAPSKKFK
jgi:hypothetical protein